MDKPKKILHIDSKWEVNYILIRDGAFIKSIIPLEGAIKMMKREVFDLILSEPHQKAILGIP
jgi:hypothetical protein